MPMITLFTMQMTALMTLFCHCKILLKKFFSLSLITKWKETLIKIIYFWAIMTKGVIHIWRIFLVLKKIGFAPWPDILLITLLTRNLPFDSDVREWSHPLMISLHCLWAKSNNRTRGQFECDVTFFFNFLYIYIYIYFVWFRSFICTVRFFHSLLTFSNCANKTGWLQNEY